MHELTLWGADRQGVRFGPQPPTGDPCAWAYWHGWTVESLALPAGPVNFLVNLTLGVGPTRILARLRPPVKFEIADVSGKRLLAGELQRGKAWQLVAVHLPGVLTVHALSLQIVTYLRLTYPLARRPDPARVEAWLAGAPALDDSPPRGLLAGEVLA